MDTEKNQHQAKRDEMTDTQEDLADIADPNLLSEDEDGILRMPNVPSGKQLIREINKYAELGEKLHTDEIEALRMTARVFRDIAQALDDGRVYEPPTMNQAKIAASIIKKMRKTAARISPDGPKR